MAKRNQTVASAWNQTEDVSANKDMQTKALATQPMHCLEIFLNGNAYNNRK